MEKFRQFTQKHAHIFMGVGIFFIILGIASIILSTVMYVKSNTSASEDKSDGPSFYLGASFSGIRGMVLLAHNDGSISEEEFTNFETLAAKALFTEEDVIYSEDVLACMEYASNFEKLKPYFQQSEEDGGFNFKNFPESFLDKLSFLEGFAVGASGVSLDIWYDGGVISDETYKTVSKKLEKIYKNPTHKGCEEYANMFAELMTKVLEEEDGKK